MIKRDYMKEIENSLKLVREEVEEGIIFKSPEKAILTINKELRGLVGLDIDTVNTLAFHIFALKNFGWQDKVVQEVTQREIKVTLEDDEE